MTFPLWLEAFIVVAMGLCLGSFLNVVIVRLPRRRSLISPSSRCGWCRNPLKFYQNVPVVSFFVSRGRCRTCGSPYSARYVWTEVAAAILAVAVWSIYGWTPAAAFLYIFALALWGVSLIDLELQIVPDEISIGGWIVAVILALVSPQLTAVSLEGALVGGASGFLFFWLISKVYAFVRKEEGLGGGDIKLMGFIGAVLGIHGVVTTIFVGALLGTVAGIFFLVLRGKTKHFPIPFAPFLTAGAFVALFKLDGWLWP